MVTLRGIPALFLRDTLLLLPRRGTVPRGVNWTDELGVQTVLLIFSLTSIRHQEA